MDVLGFLSVHTKTKLPFCHIWQQIWNSLSILIHHSNSAKSGKSLGTQKRPDKTLHCTWRTYAWSKLLYYIYYLYFWKVLASTVKHQLRKSLPRIYGIPTTLVILARLYKTHSSWPKASPLVTSSYGSGPLAINHQEGVERNSYIPSQ